jgi:hypothetical protein
MLVINIRYLNYNFVALHIVQRNVSYSRSDA